MFKRYLIAVTFSVLSLSSFAQVVEEITVTAARKVQSLQDVALSVQAISGEDLAASHIVSASDLATTVPGYGFANGIGNGVTTKVRGLFIAAVGAASTDGAQIALNGHNVSGSNFTEAGFLDLERLEILEGPQGTLYGRNTTTGLVNVISARPGAGNYLSYSYGEDGYSNLRAAYDFDLTDNVQGRIASQKYDKDGTIKNLGTGKMVDTRDSGSIRLSLDWSISDTQELKTNYSRYYSDDSRQNINTSSCKRDRFFGCDPFITDSSSHLNNAAIQEGTITNTYDALTLINTSTDYFGNPAAGSTSIDAISKDIDVTRQMSQNIFQIEHVWDLSDNLVMKSKATSYDRSYLHMDDSDHAKADTALVGALGAFSIPTMNFVCLGEVATASLHQTLECSNVSEEQEQYEVNIISSFDGQHNFTAGAYSYESDYTNAYNIQTTSYMLATNFNLHPYSQTVFGGALDGYGGTAFYTALATNFAVYAATLGNALTADSGVIGANTRNVGAIIANNLSSENSTVAGINVGCNQTLCVKQLPIEAGGLITDQRTGRSDQAVYGEYYYDISDDLKFTVGARYMRNSTTVRTMSGLADGAGAYQLTATSLSCRAADYEACYAEASTISRVKDEAATYKVGLQQFIDQGMLYASYTEGYRPGSVNSDGTSYQQEDTSSIELGARTTWMDGRLRLNATLFNQESENAHFSVIRATSSPVVEGITADHTGLSLDAQFFLTDNTVLSFNALATDSELTGGSDVDPLNPTQATSYNYYTSSQLNEIMQSRQGSAVANLVTSCATSCSSAGFMIDNHGNYLTNAQGSVTVITALGSTSTPVNMTGNDIPGTSDLDYNVSITQLVEGSMGLTSATLTYSYKGDFQGDIYNNARFATPDADYIDLSVNFEPNGADWYVTAWAKNLEDKRNVTSVQRTGPLSGGVANYTYAEGMRAGLDFGIEF